MARRNIASGSPLEGKIGFSRAVRVGPFVAVAGTAPIAPGGGTAGPGDVEAQTRRCLDIAAAALAEAGASLDDVIRTRIMLTDIDSWEAAARAHGALFGAIRPACTFVEVSRFIDPAWLVEVELDAVVDDWDDDWDVGRGTRDAGDTELDDWVRDVMTLEEEHVAYQAVRDFEDLRAWQMARQLTASVYQLGRESALRDDFGLRNQIQRAAVSVMSNIAEGHERGSSQEYHRYLGIAKASCAEVRSLLFVVYDAGYITDETFDDFFSKTRGVGQLIGALRASIARRIAQQKR